MATMFFKSVSQSVSQSFFDYDLIIVYYSTINHAHCIVALNWDERNVVYHTWETFHSLNMYIVYMYLFCVFVCHWTKTKIVRICPSVKLPLGNCLRKILNFYFCKIEKTEFPCNLYYVFFPSTETKINFQDCSSIEKFSQFWILVKFPYYVHIFSRLTSQQLQQYIICPKNLDIYKVCPICLCFCCCCEF